MNSLFHFSALLRNSKVILFFILCKFYFVLFLTFFVVKRISKVTLFFILCKFYFHFFKKYLNSLFLTYYFLFQCAFRFSIIFSNIVNRIAFKSTTFFHSVQILFSLSKKYLLFNELFIFLFSSHRVLKSLQKYANFQYCANFIFNFLKNIYFYFSFFYFIITKFL